MKIRFSKVATLFLAGAALLAAGCTDYQSDINDIYVKIDELASKESVATLQNQVVVLSNALDALKSDHSKDIAALQSSIDALKSADAQFTSQIAALDGKIGDNAKDIASLKTALANTDKTIADHVAAFNEYKTQVQSALTELSKKDTELAGKIEAAETALRAEIAAVQKLVEAEAATRADADKVLGERIDAALKEIAAESNRAQLKEKELQDAIDAEVAARKAADEAAAAALAAEVKRAEDAEALLDAAIKAEEKARAAADEVLTKRIAAEERAREVADSLLNEAIKAEAIARDEAIKAAVKAEAEARIEADSLLQAYAESIDKKVDDLRTEYDAFKADVEGEIAGLKTRLDAAEAAIKNIDASIKTINGQIKDLQEADSLLRVDMEAGDQYVLDSLNVVKAATEKSIAALQNAVKDIVAVNKDQSDSLKAAFAKFNDYVLTTTFEAYQNEVEAALKAKADTAALNAAVKRINDHDLRIVALEAYKNELVETIIPGLEAADRALKASIDSLGGVVAEVKENVDTLNSHMAKAEATIAQHTLDIAALAARTSALEQWQAVAEENIQSLLSRIRSVEFVPDYTDKYITIDLAMMDMFSNVDNNMWQYFIKAFYAPSEITYKVYPTEMADSLAKYFSAHDNDGAIYFDVVRLKNSGSRHDETDEDVKLPELEITDVKKSDRTKGAVTFTVKPRNVDDFKAVWETSANLILNKLYHGNDETIEFAELAAKLAFIASDKVQLLGEVLGLLEDRREDGETEKFEPFYSSALVIEGVDGGHITSEYNIWTAGVSATLDSPWFGKYKSEPEDGFNYSHVDYIYKEVEYTDTEEYGLADSVDIVSWYRTRDGKEDIAKFDEVVRDLGIDVQSDVAAIREYDCDHSETESDKHLSVFYKEPAKYGLTEEDLPFSPEIDEFVRLKSQLLPTSDIATRKAAIGDSEAIYYATGINGIPTDYLNTVFTITKTKAKAVVDTVVINWEYAQDVAVDAKIYNRGSNDGTDVYSRTNIVLSFDPDSTNLTQKGVSPADFYHASSKLISYTVKDSLGNVVAYYDKELDKLVEELVIKLDINAKREVVASISNFKWDETYTISAVYDLDDAVVTVSGVIKTNDRPRKPVTVDFGTFTKVYAKDMNFNLRGCMTYGKATPLKDHSVKVEFEGSPVDVQKLIVDLYGPTAKVPEALAKDLWAEGHEFVGTADAGDAYVNVKDTCNNAIFAISYLDYTKPVLDTLSATFFTYYGQEIDVRAVIDVKAPKYDFRHNIYRVFDNGTTEAESHPTSDVKVTGRFYSNVEPAYNEDKWNKFSLFNVAAINLPEAFVVVDETMSEVAKADQDAAGLVLNFTLEDELESNTDDRSNTFINIENNKLMYHGYEEKVAVHGAMAIKNTGGHLFTFPTSFDEGFEAIYADVLEPGDTLTVGRYADYEVVKFNPLHSFRSTKDVTIQLFDAKKYTVNVLSNLSLLDQRKYDANDPTMPKGAGNTNGVELFESGFWKKGTGNNLFANGVKANEAYDIASEFKKNIADDVHEDIKKAISLTEPSIGVVKFEFDYTQQMVITQPVVVDVNAELTHPWVKDPLTATVKVTIKK